MIGQGACKGLGRRWIFGQGDGGASRPLFCAPQTLARLRVAVAGLAALHGAGARKHHLVDWDDVLRRMLPRRWNNRIA